SRAPAPDATGLANRHATAAQILAPSIAHRRGMDKLSQDAPGGTGIVGTAAATLPTPLMTRSHHDLRSYCLAGGIGRCPAMEGSRGDRAVEYAGRADGLPAHRAPRGSGKAVPGIPATLAGPGALPGVRADPGRPAHAGAGGLGRWHAGSP